MPRMIGFGCWPSSAHSQRDTPMRRGESRNNMTARVEIRYLADCPELVPKLARWVCEEFGHLDSTKTPEQVERMLRKRLNRDRLPLTLIAFAGSEPIGSASLQNRGVSSRPQYAPWLGTVVVRRPHRNKGIGSQLVQRAAQVARRLGVRELYLHTPDRESLYSRLGWMPVERIPYRGQDTVIMKRNLAKEASTEGSTGPATPRPKK